MNKIKIEKQISEERKKEINCSKWPIWSSPAETFDWEYDETEVCLILQGKVKVSTKDGEVTEFEKGDLVVFPKGLVCTWEVIEPVRKVYKFGEV